MTDEPDWDAMDWDIPGLEDYARSVRHRLPDGLGLVFWMGRTGWLAWGPVNGPGENEDEEILAFAEFP